MSDIKVCTPTYGVYFANTRPTSIRKLVILASASFASIVNCRCHIFIYTATTSLKFRSSIFNTMSTSLGAN